MLKASLLQPLAAAHINNRDYKKRQRCRDEYCVLHPVDPLLSSCLL
jgi:hypothetical protein